MTMKLKKTREKNSSIVITSPRTVMDELSLKNKYKTEENNETKNYERKKEEKEKNVNNIINNNDNNNNNNNNNNNKDKNIGVRTDWSKFAVTVPKSLEQMWNGGKDQENSESRQDSPVVLVKTDSLDVSDDENGPMLLLPPAC